MADSEFLMNKQLLKKIEDKERSQKMSPQKSTAYK